MTTIRLNGEERRLASDDTAPTILAALALLDVAPDARGIAVAVDREVVPRGRWQETTLADGAQVEVVTAIQGG